MKPRAALDLNVTEQQFQEAVVAFARMNKWLVYHTYDARRSEPGFPDLVLCRPETNVFPGQLLYAELKTQTGRVSAAQVRWLTPLRSAGVEVHVWRPADWPEIVARLKRRHSLPIVEQAS